MPGSMCPESRLLTGRATERKGRESEQRCEQSSRYARRPPSQGSQSCRAVARQHRAVGAPIQPGTDSSFRPHEELAHFVARHLREVVDIEAAERAVAHPLIASHSLPGGLARHGDPETPNLNHDELRGRLHLHPNAGLGTKSDEVVERELIHLVSRNFRDAWLRYAQTFGSLRLCDPFPVDPFAQSLGQFASQKHHCRFMRREAEIDEDVATGFGV